MINDEAIKIMEKQEKLQVYYASQYLFNNIRYLDNKIKCDKILNICKTWEELENEKSFSDGIYNGRKRIIKQIDNIIKEHGNISANELLEKLKQ